MHELVVKLRDKRDDLWDECSDIMWIAEEILDL
jgi:hypothetical protein